MTLLTVITHVGPCRLWSVIRNVITVLLSLVVGCVSAIYYDANRKFNYLNSPWLLPTIPLAWLVVLALAHAHNFPDGTKGRREGGNASFNWPKVYSAVEGKGLRRATYEARDGTVIMEHRFEPQREQADGMAGKGLPKRSSFYDQQVGYDGSGYAGYGQLAQRVGVQQSTAYEPSFDPRHVQYHRAPH